MQEILNKHVKTIKQMLGYSPYIVVSSAYKEVREFITEALKEDVLQIEDYELVYPSRETINAYLQNSHVQLLNFEEKIENYKNSYTSIGKDVEYAEYYAMIPFRDWFRKNNMHSIVIVCDNETTRNLCCDANLTSATTRIVLDNKLTKNEKDKITQEEM